MKSKIKEIHKNLTPRKSKFHDEWLLENYGNLCRIDYTPMEGFYFKVYGGREDFFENKFSELNRCELCGKIGTIKKVRMRYDVYRWNANGKKDFETKSKDTLCTGCWNKARSIQKRYLEAERTRLFINRIKKEISYERKNKNNR